MTTETTTPQEQAQRIWEQIEAEETGSASPPAAEPKQTETPPTEAADAARSTEGAKPAEAEPQDPDVLKRTIAGLEALVKQQADALAQVGQRVRSVEGKIGGLNSMVKQQVDAAAKTVRAAGGDAPTATEIAAAGASPEALEELKREYPEFAKVLVPLLESQRSVIEDLRKRVGSTPAAPAAEANTGAEPAPEPANGEPSPAQLMQRVKELQVETIHKGWKDTVKTLEFRGWLEGAPREVRLLAASDEPEDAIRLLDLWSEAKTKQQPPPQTQQRLAAAARLPGGHRTPVQTVNVDEMTPEQFWQYLDEKERREAASQGR